MFLRRVVRDGGITRRVPVAIAHARTRADHENLSAGAEHLLSECLRTRRSRNIPTQNSLLYAERLDEAEETVLHVLALTCGDAMVGEQPLKILRPWPIEAEPHRARYAQTCE